MSWIYNGEEFTSEMIAEHLGFVYLITHIPSGKKYIGKKLFLSAKTKVLKGKKKRYKVESDWKKYWSSSDLIKSMIKEEGEHAFSRQILHLCGNKGTLSYLEAREQMDRRVLEHPEEYLNGQIQCRIHWTHVKL